MTLAEVRRRSTLLPVNNNLNLCTEAHVDRELVDGWGYDDEQDSYVVTGREGYLLESNAYKKLLPYQRRE